MERCSDESRWRVEGKSICMGIQKRKGYDSVAPFKPM